MSFPSAVRENEMIHFCHPLATALPCPHEAVMIKYEEGKERETTVLSNAVAVKLPGHDAPLFLVAAKGFGKEPTSVMSSRMGSASFSSQIKPDSTRR